MSARSQGVHVRWANQHQVSCPDPHQLTVDQVVPEPLFDPENFGEIVAMESPVGRSERDPRDVVGLSRCKVPLKAQRLNQQDVTGVEEIALDVEDPSSSGE